MNTSRLLGLTAIAIGLGGFGWYFIKGEGRTVISRAAPGLQRAADPILPSTPRLTRSDGGRVPPKVTRKMMDSIALPPNTAPFNRDAAVAERTRQREQRAARRQTMIEAAQAIQRPLR